MSVSKELKIRGRPKSRTLVSDRQETYRAEKFRMDTGDLKNSLLSPFKFTDDGLSALSGKIRVRECVDSKLVSSLISAKDKVGVL